MRGSPSAPAQAAPLHALRKQQRGGLSSPQGGRGHGFFASQSAALPWPGFLSRDLPCACARRSAATSHKTDSRNAGADAVTGEAWPTLSRYVVHFISQRLSLGPLKANLGVLQLHFLLTPPWRGNLCLFAGPRLLVCHATWATVCGTQSSGVCAGLPGNSHKYATAAAPKQVPMRSTGRCSASPTHRHALPHRASIGMRKRRLFLYFESVSMEAI